MMLHCNSLLKHVNRSWLRKIRAVNAAYTTRVSSGPPVYLVVGGVAGGATVSARMRRNSDKAKIVMFERGQYVSFANCGLPYYVGNVIKDERKLLVASPDMFTKRFNIEVRNESNVKSIDRKNKQITIENQGKTYTESYDKLILAVGASPIRPPIEGMDCNGVFSVRSIENSRAIRDYMDKLPSSRKKCAIVGAGFIGLEMAENMVHRGYECTVIDGLPHVMGIMDHEMVIPFHRVLTEHGIRLLMNEKLQAIKNKNKSTDALPELQVVTDSQQVIDADIVILGLGVLPENQLAKECGLELGTRGSIKVNKQMQTSDADIFAVGDAVETYHCVSNTPINLALAGPAQQQARLVADVITGVYPTDTYRGVQGSSVCAVFGEILATTGLTMTQLQRMGSIPGRDMNNICAVYAHPGHHADFYPDAKKLHLKLIFDRSDGRVLGAQCAGTQGVVKAIDTIAAFMQMGATVYDLAHAELCYAPQYGSARGPVNIVGQMGMNVCDGLLDIAEWSEIVDAPKLENKVHILDVRTEAERNADPIETNAHVQVIALEVDELRTRVDELDEYKQKGVTLYTMCGVGKRGYVAARFLKQNGYNAKLCPGGMISYHMAKYEFAYHR